MKQKWYLEFSLTNQKVQMKMTGIIKFDKNVYNPWISFTAAEDEKSY